MSVIISESILKKYLSNSIAVIIILLLQSGYVFSQEQSSGPVQEDSVPALNFHFNDSRLPFQPTDNITGLYLKMPSNFKKTIEFDPITNSYIFKEQIGTLNYSEPYSMSIEEYQKYMDEEATKKYWTDRRKNDKVGNASTFLPTVNLGGEAFDKIFGSNTINIVPQGSAELIFGINNSEVNNPNISEALRSTTTFNFQEKIQMNIIGTIGDKMKVAISYNTDATFQFENKTKLEYTGKEDDIVKKVEAGNVSLPLEGTLISGSQSLFGIKTELQFGKLKATSVISQQQGQSSVIEVKGGATVNNFEISCDDSDANRHFFLSHYFRSIYENSLKQTPLVNSPIMITRIEVWLTNKTGNFTNARNTIALMDLAESKDYIYNKLSEFQQNVFTSPGDFLPHNEISKIYSSIINNYNGRNIQNASSKLASLNSIGFQSGRDYEILENARMLAPTEYTLNAKLGYISLNVALNSDKVLSVAYEYTYNGVTYRVGELSTDVSAPNTIITKMLKASTFTPETPNWDLMMKNVYSLNAYQVQSANFRLDVVYHDDKLGSDVNYIPEGKANDYILLRVLGLDRLNQNNDPTPDGYFDFLEGVTINATSGEVFFPVLEPFGSSLVTAYEAYDIPQNLIDNYAFPQLYNSTQVAARQFANLNKFKLKGTYQSNVNSDIPLNATNIPQGSVVVTAGGRQLAENVDYTVDYTLGRVKILNTALLQSGTSIKISLESNSTFNMQTKTMIGTHLDYKLNDNLTLGATAVNLTERPLTQKVNIGDEPISNTMVGLNGTYTAKAPYITTWLKKVPGLSHLKDPSAFTITAELADLIPGTAGAINNTAYIDDFESSETTIAFKDSTILVYCQYTWGCFKLSRF